MTFFWHSFYVENKHGFRESVVDWKGDGFAETGTTVLEVGKVPFKLV